MAVFGRLPTETRRVPRQRSRQAFRVDAVRLHNGAAQAGATSHQGPPRTSSATPGQRPGRALGAGEVTHRDLDVISLTALPGVDHVFVI